MLAPVAQAQTPAPERMESRTAVPATQTLQDSTLTQAHALMEEKRYDEAISQLKATLYHPNIHYSPPRHKADLYRALGNAYRHASQFKEAERTLLFALNMYSNLEVGPLAHAELLAEVAQLEADIAQQAASRRQPGSALHHDQQISYLKQAVVVLGRSPTSSAYLEPMANLTCQLADIYQANGTSPTPRLQPGSRQEGASALGQPDGKKADAARKLRQACLQARSKYAARNIAAHQQAMLEAVEALGLDNGNDANTDDPVVTLPKAIHTVAPEYPIMEQRLRREGIVTLRLQVDSEGNLTGLAVAMSSGFAKLDSAALAAAEQWKFEPAITKSGKKSGAMFDLPFAFSLRQAKLPPPSQGPAPLAPWPPRH